MRTCASYIRLWWHKFQSLNRRSKYASLFVVLIALVGIFLVPHITHAQITVETVTDGIIIALAQFFLWLASLGIQLAIFFLKFFIVLAGYNGFINADIVKFGWSIIRDVANMFFIVILLVIAFGTILGLEQYEWKKSLPKLVFAAIFVNFSNVICQLIIDVAQVFTITFLNAVAGTAGGNLISMMNFTEVLSFTSTVPNAGTDIKGDIIIGALFAVFFTFIAAAAIGSYMIVMLYRMVTLWCLIILSPLAFLFSVLPSTKSYADEFWKEFVNHVIAAPMMVFFLWLAFATFGAGNVVDSLQGPGNNSLPEQKLDTDSNAVGARSHASISKAAEWMNMANFAVAIAFLMMGMERVQKLGVKGGDYIQRGLEFGKKVATIATGISLAQSVGRGAWDKGVSGGKAALGATAGFAVGKLGGNYVKRKAKNVYNRARAMGTNVNIVRDNFGQRAEKAALGLFGDSKLGKLGGKGLAGLMGLGTLGVLKSERRAEKESENWEKTADARKKRHDEEISTSHTKSGDKYLTESIKLQFAERKSAAGKDLKFATREAELLAQGKNAGELSKAYGKGKWADIAHGTAKAEGKAANIKEQLHKEHGDEVAKARANAYRDNKDFLRAEAIERSNLSNFAAETQKLFSGMQQGEFVGKGNEITDRIRQMNATAAAGGKIDEEERSKLIQQAASILATATAKDAETGENTFRAMLAGAHWTEDITDENKNRAAMSALTGKVVGNTPADMEAARNEIEASFGGGASGKQQYNEAMRNMFSSFNKATSEGSAMFAGMVSDGVGTDNKAVYDFGQNVGVKDKRGTPHTAPQNFSANKDSLPKYWAGRMPLSRLVDAASIGSSNIKGELTGMSAEQAKGLGLMFKGKDKRAVAQGVQGSFYDSMNDAGKTALTGTQKLEFEQMYKDIAKNVADLDAFEHFVDSTKDLWNGVGLTNPAVFFTTYHV